jgi:hypothetical protein
MDTTIVDLSFCTKALTTALAMSKQSIQVEVAVAFVTFYELGGTELSMKRDLRQIYHDAGRVDCLTADSRSYQTVTRRINRCAALYQKIGSKRLARVLKGKEKQELIDAVIEFLAPLEIESMDDVAAHAGMTRKRAEDEATHEPDKHDRRATDAPGTTHVKTKHIDVAVPPDTPANELIALANKLLALAQKIV